MKGRLILLVGMLLSLFGVSRNVAVSILGGKGIHSCVIEIKRGTYSLSSNAKMIDESFDETNEIKSWTGGNTDFSYLDDDDSVSANEEKAKNQNNEK